MIEREGHAHCFQRVDRHCGRRAVRPPVMHRGVTGGEQRARGEGRDGPHFFHPLDLVGAHVGGVDEHRAAVGHAIELHRAFDGPQRLLGGGIAVHVHVDLDAGLPELVEDAVHIIIWQLLEAAIVALLVGGIVRIGLAEPCGGDRPVEPQLDATQAHTVDVALVEVGSCCQQLARGVLVVDVIFGGHGIGGGQHVAHG